MAATLRGTTNGLSTFPSASSSASWSLSRNSIATNSLTFPSMYILNKSLNSRGCIACSTVRESSTSTAAETKAAPEKAVIDSEKKEVKPKPAAKAPVKSLPQMMEEDVIPPLKSILESQQDLSELQLSFNANKLEGSFLKNDFPYSFWAFFPEGNLTGPKGFSLSSYGSEASTVEPFLVDEKKITAQHVIFWVEKRLAAQGIIPVWREEEEEEEKQ